MKMTTIMACFELVPVVLLVATVATTATNKEDHYLLSCGAPVSKPSDFDNQRWYSDYNATFSTSFSSTIAATTTSSRYGEALSTARIFTSSFTYHFPVTPGPKFVRLFFYPSQSNYSSRTLSLSDADSYLTVQANPDRVLLRNFSAYLNSDSSDYYLIKEFYVHVNDSTLQLTFSPTPPCSYALVNAIEVVSVPETLYVRPTSPINVDQPTTDFVVSDSYALETAYRLNVGGTDVNPSQDSGSMYRRWVKDDSYVNSIFPELTGLSDGKNAIQYSKETPRYSAPDMVYNTFRSMGQYDRSIKERENVTWGFKVDLGFHYLMRLHWCEVVVKINASYFRMFDVYIDDKLADEGVDIYGWEGGIYKPVFKDYVVYMDGGDGSGSKGFLKLAMHPNPQSWTWNGYCDVLLNGLELFKINRSDGSLNAPNPRRPPLKINPNDQKPSPSSHRLSAIIGAISAAVVLSILLCYLFILRRRKWLKMAAGSSAGTTSSKSKRVLSSGKSGTTKRSGGGSTSLPSHLCRYFSLAEIKLATSDFSDSLIIGHGGFGNVYKGTVNSEYDGPITVAIKRLNPLSNQGAREFKMEIELLSRLRHLHLVSLIGYCDASGEMILVYEYMSRGTLRDHLYPHNITHLPWLQRLEICVGAARGLHYLHTGTDRMVIHRDVKSTNILLDERWVAKVSDFGLSKLCPAGGDLVSHVSTAVKGSFGYVDPEYYRRQQLTEKSDVYSFGVVLFEVLCGRAAVNPNLPKEQVNLRIWARRNQLTGTLDRIVDPTLKGQISTECLRKFGDVAESCVRDEGVLRPSMADVIGGLELAHQLQLESFVPNNINQPLSWTTMTSATDQGVRDETTLDEEHHITTTNINSPTTDASVRLIRNPGESTWTSVNNSSSRSFSSTSEAYGGSTQVFSQIFNADGR